MQTKVSTNAQKKMQENDAALINSRIDKMRDALALTESKEIELQTEWRTDKVEKTDIARLSHRIDELKQNYEGAIAEISATKTCQKSMASVQQKVQETDSARLHSRLDKLSEDCASVHAEISVLNGNAETSLARESEFEKGMKGWSRTLEANMSNKLSEHEWAIGARINEMQNEMQASGSGTGATQALILELQREIQAMTTRDGQMQIAVSSRLDSNSELNQQFAAGVSVRMNELQEELWEVRRGAKELQAAVVGQTESAQARDSELWREIRSRGAESEINALRQQTSTLEAQFKRLGEELNGAQTQNSGWVEGYREVNAALKSTDDKLESYAAGFAALDKWTEFSNECRNECKAMRECMSRTEKCEAGVFASQHIEREARKSDTAKLMSRLEALEKDRDQSFNTVPSSNYLLGSRGVAASAPPSAYLLSERQLEPASPSSVVLPGSSVLPLKEGLKSPVFGFRAESDKDLKSQSASSEPGTAVQSVEPAGPIIGSRPEPPPKSGRLPKAGETWVFTGKVDKVAVFSSSAARDKIHDLSCYWDGGKLRRIEILTSVEGGQQYVRFRGTQNLHWLEGWIAMHGEDGSWNIVKSDEVFDQDSDCTFT